ncbi:hypothetical protein quinque_000009, partial [Culex quinquefasciatus]
MIEFVQEDEDAN